MKKGQAAIEFFVTYGWAILAFVIVLGYLMTSGILTPNYLVSEECTFGNNLPCDFALYNVGDSTHLALRIFNGFPDKIRIDEISIQSRDGNQEFELLDFSPTEIQSGGSVTFEAALPGNQIEENMMKRFSGNITYVSCASELGTECSDSQHVITGRVSGKVIPE